MKGDTILVSVEVPRKKYYNEDILKAVMSSEVLYYKSEEEDYFSLPLKIGNKKQTDLVLKIIRDYIDEERRRLLKLNQKTEGKK